MNIRAIESLTVSEDATILQAIQCIDAGAMQIAMVVDAERCFVGIVTDGDVRRAILRGQSLEAPVSSITNRTPRVARDGTPPEELTNLLRAYGVLQIPLVDDNGRLTGLFSSSNLAFMEDADATVVLMAGGLGTRLRPLTQDMPKPMVPVGGKPMLETIVDRFAGQGFRDIVISVNYLADTIIDHFRDGRRFGVRISYIRETKRMGTAGSLRLLPERPNRPIVIMNSDIMTAVDFRKMLQFHLDRNATATMAVLKRSYQIPFGVIETDGYAIRSVVEKPEHTFLINAGIYVLNPICLEMIPQDTFFDMPMLFDKLIAANAQPAAYPLHEYWRDVGRIDDLQSAEAEFDAYF